MKPLLFAVCCITVAHACAAAQSTGWQPSPGHTQIPIWPGVPPDAVPIQRAETAKLTDQDVGGRRWTYVENVSRPTMTVYSPKGKNTGLAAIVFPGGGYHLLAMDLEGTEVCDWLTSRGITCVLLKYRVPGLALYPKPAFPRAGPYPESAVALEDAQRTIGLVRQRAAEWHIDPHKIGVIGFSAGGHMVAALSNHFDKRVYAPVDAADGISCRPDFAIAIYPGHLSKVNFGLELVPDIATHITKQTPPTFLLHAEDDPYGAEHSVVYYIALKKAGVPVEMHLYPGGGHAFGMRPTKFPITRWPQLVETWLSAIGMTRR